MRTILISFTVGLLLSSTAWAGSVDHSKSTFQWTGSKKIGSKHSGKIFLKSATVEHKDGKVQSAKFVMDMNSFTVEDLEGEWEKKFIGHMKSEDFFDVSKFPTATLELGKQTQADSVSGQFTVKGKTQPMTIKFTKGKRGNYKGRLTVDRTKFGIIYGSKSFFKKLVGDKVINNEFHIDFDVSLK